MSEPLSSFPWRMVDTRSGPMVVVANDIFVNSVLTIYGEYSGDEIKLLRSLCRPGDLVLDIGAHVGSITLGLADAVGTDGRVVSFEPQPELYEALSRNIDLRGLSQVRPVNAGAGDEAGILYVNHEHGVMQFNKGASFLSETGEHPVDVVQVDSLGLPACALAKIDVEGMELRVLQGATQTITSDSVVYFENSPFEHSSSLSDSHAILSHFLDKDYRLFWHLPHFVARGTAESSGIDLFADGGSFNVLAVPSGFIASDRWSCVDTTELFPIEQADELAFPDWIHPQLIRHSFYDRLRSNGPVPLRSDDDPDRPWMVLYQAFLDYLARRSEAGKEASRFAPGVEGWAYAKLWFGHLTDRPAGASTTIRTYGTPAAFDSLLAGEFTFAEDHGAGQGSDDYVVIVAAPDDTALEGEIQRLGLAGSQRETVRISGASRKASLPAPWCDGPDVSLAMFEPGAAPCSPA